MAGMTDSASEQPVTASTASTASSAAAASATADAATPETAAPESTQVKRTKKKGAGYKAGTVGLMVLTGVIAFIGVATIVGGLQQLAVDSCSRAGGLSCSVPAANQVPWIEFGVGIVCLGLLWMLLRRR